MFLKNPSPLAQNKLDHLMEKSFKAYKLFCQIPQRLLHNKLDRSSKTSQIFDVRIYNLMQLAKDKHSSLFLGDCKQ